MTEADYREAALPDGRTLEYLVEGVPDGPVLAFQHGTPGSAVPNPPVSEAAAERGLALVAPTRAGYGPSSRDEGRSVADVVPDIAAIVDDLGHDRFVTLGWSGGGPHALACAALLPDRCAAATSGAGVAPFDTGGELDFLAGMGPENIEEFGLATRGAQALRPWLEATAAEMMAATPDDLVEAFGGLLPPVDRAHVTSERAARMLASIRHGCGDGVDGWLDDDLAYVRDWGFDLAAIDVPVSVWQGGKDLMVPFAHGQWLATAVPGARVHLHDDEGHISLQAQMGTILDDLLDLAGW